tara:strand:- start:96 stop:200 length:105 start_codon:yes stop_codon:yes gene_type:complete
MGRERGIVTKDKRQAVRVKKRVGEDTETGDKGEY